MVYDKTYVKRLSTQFDQTLLNKNFIKNSHSKSVDRFRMAPV